MNLVLRILQPLPALARPLVVAGIVAGASFLLHKALYPPRRNTRRRATPDIWIDNPGIEEASRFRKNFHWGNETQSVGRRKISKPPKVAVKLGTLEGVIYRTNKKGDGMSSYIHEFSGRKPTLLMDIDNRRLHISGGKYNVVSDGIVG